jgi:hypothetical protein
MKIEVSTGEIVDKYTILSIKKVMLIDIEQLFNVNKEWVMLSEEIRKVQGLMEDPLVWSLLDVNNKLWHIDDELRKLEASQDFGEHFIATARMVYKLNDERYQYREQINAIYHSELTEEKSH